MRFFLIKMILMLGAFVLTSCGGENSDNTPTTSPKNKTSEVTTTPKKKKKQIIFFGDSLTAGYGLDDPSDSFVGVIQKRLDSLKMDYATINAGVSGETSSGGAARIDWVLEQENLDVFILELGANDGLRGLQPTETIKNLQSIFSKVKTKFPEAKLVLAGMLAPPNMGAEFTKSFGAIFPKLAKENEAAFIPFLLDGVGGIPELNQRDGIHPTVAGHKILAENIWKVLKEVL